MYKLRSDLRYIWEGNSEGEIQKKSKKEMQKCEKKKYRNGKVENAKIEK